MTENPLSTEQAQAVQKAWADHLGVDAVVESSIGMQLSLIPPGTFRMGWEERTGEDGPQKVTHSQPYFIGRHEVTQGEWVRVMGPLGERRKEVGDRLPVNGINHAEAAEFCRKLTQVDREAGKLPEGYEYRLPTDAELEYACRAGTTTVTYFGDTLSSTQANFDGRQPLNKGEKGPFLNRLAEVGSYPGNAWGLHDTYGSLYEWCFDWYHARVKGGVDPVHLLPSPDRPVAKRVKRGGAWKYAGRYCRSANRYYDVPENRSSVVGFRPVLSKLHLDAFHQLADASQTEYLQTWTRDGTNTRIWHKRDLKTRNDFVMSGPINSLPGESYAIPMTARSHHTWAHTCLTDGRILVQSNPPNQEPGYFLMTPNKGGTPKYERIQCDLAAKGILDRIRLSPSEREVCFEFQAGFEKDVPGRTLYVADFDAKQAAITNARPFANEDGKPVWFAWPRWSKDESAIVYQADGQLYQYHLAERSTTLAGAETSSIKSKTNDRVDSATPERVVMTDRAFTAEQAQAAQRAWAEHIGIEVAFENSIGMHLRVIPSGTYRISSRRVEESQMGPFEVSLSQAFLIGQFEVTQGEWKRVMGSSELEFDAGDGDRFPVYRVTHTEASEFCRKLTRLEREAGKLPDGYEYRLPTSVEWEFACRAGTLTRYPSGESMSSRLANYDGTQPYRDTEEGPFLGRTAEVGSYPANAWGLHDMLGNVTEWCLDYYQHKVEGGVDPVRLKPSDPGNPRMVIRGASWRSGGKYCHSANRYFSRPDSRTYIGLRPVLTEISPVATGQASLTQADTTAAASSVTTITHADDSDEPERVLMTEDALTAEQAKASQQAWADHLGVDAVVENSIDMQLCLIPPGTFPMGDDYGKGWRGHKVVTHTKPFFIGRYEVTRGEWGRVMGSFHGQPKVGVDDRFPRNGVDYAESAEFCQKLTRLEREAGKLPEGYEYRLPTDAELEYATRAGTLTLTYFGDKLSSRQANFDGAYPLKGAEEGPNLGRTVEVGSYPANAWGLYDTLGNVSEWCLDLYHWEPKGGVDPLHRLPPPERRVPARIVRGGYHSRAGGYCRSANRYYHLAEDGSSLTGFRVALSKLHLDGLAELTDIRHTEFDQAWTRDGTNWRVWNKRNPKTAGHHVMLGNIDHIPGGKNAVAISDRSHHTWAHTCLTDGRILVRSQPPNQELGYYLMTPNERGTPKYERIQCDLAAQGILDRISLSPSETRVCFEFRSGFDGDVPGRTLYVADFDAKKPAITDAGPVTNEDGKPIWYAFPRWSKDESAIVYQADGALYLYKLADKSTTEASTNDPHVKRAPK